jgi:uncharacterized protein (DUF2141 family)
MANANSQVTTCSISVVVTGLKNTQGRLCLSLFDAAEGFPSQAERAIAKCHISAAEPNPRVIFDSLKPGQYAIAAFHDANGDGILNRGLMGIPKEGFGFSNNPKILVGAPSFKRAAIALAPGNLEICIQLKHFV